MADSVADIIINVAANVNSAVMGLNQVRSTATNAAAGASNAISGFQTKMTSSAASVVTMNGRMGSMIKTTADLGNKVNAAGTRIQQAGQSIKRSIGTDAALAFGVAGAAATGFAKKCIDAAVSSESSWTRFGALVNSSGGNWDENSSKIKQWAKNHSNSMGYAVSDTREAASTILQSGFSYNQLGVAMNGVAGLAARTGQTQAEASAMITSALMGRFNTLSKVTGLQKEDYMDASGNIDKMKLLTDLYNMNSDAIKAHGNTTEAALARMGNAWGAFKTGIGQALLPVLQMFAGIAESALNLFNSLPGPIKTAVAVFLVLGGAIGVGLGALGFLAPALINLGTIMRAVSSAGNVMSLAMRAMSITARLSGNSVKADSLSKTANIFATDADAAANITLSGALKMAATGFLQLAAAILTNPITWIAIAVIALVAIMWHLYNTNAEVKKGIDDLANAIKGGLMVAWNGLQTVGQMLWAGLEKLGQTVYTLLIPVWQNLQQMTTPLVAAFYKLYYSLQQLWAVLNGGGGDATANSFNVLAAAGQVLGAVIVSAIMNIVTIFQVLSGIVIPIITGIINIFSAFITGIGGAVNVLNQLVNGNINLSQAVGMLWDNFITMLSNIGGAVMQAGGQILTNLGIVFGDIPATLNAAFSAIIPGISAALTGFIMVIQQRFVQARNYAANYITQLGNRIWQTLQGIPARARLAFNSFVLNIRLSMVRAWTTAVLYAGNIRNAIVNRISNMVARVRSFFSNIPAAIRSRLSTAASNAISGAKQIYDNIINKIKEIPKQVESELKSLPGKITSALASAASAALSGAAAIVKQFAAGLQRASPGKIYKDTLDEFKHVVGVIEDTTPEAATKTRSMAENVVENWQNTLPTALNIPKALFGNIPRFDIGFNNIDAAILKNNYNELTRPAAMNNSSSSTNINNDDHHNNIHIENITLECNNLTKSESRRILYNALDGLYNGGI